jgi:hypothetical protein
LDIGAEVGLAHNFFGPSGTIRILTYPTKIGFLIRGHVQLSLDKMRSAEMLTALRVEPGQSFYWNLCRSDLEIITMKSDFP